jgi:fructokinase
VHVTLPTTIVLANLDENGAATYHLYPRHLAAAVAALKLAPTTLHVGTLGLVLEPPATTTTALVDGVAARIWLAGMVDGIHAGSECRF